MSCFLPVSCLALNDLIRVRQADDLIGYLAEIWETLFRVLDDIKVSTLYKHASCALCRMQRKVLLNTQQRHPFLHLCENFNILLQESVRKAADLTLKTLSKVTAFVPRTSWFGWAFACRQGSEFLFGFRCAHVCVSLQALQPRELWLCSYRPCWKKALWAMWLRSVR